MPKPYLIAVAVLVVLVLLMILKARLARRGVYYLRDSLFTAAELAFLQVLEPVLPRGVRVFGKVRLADIMGVRQGLERGKWQAAFNKIAGKHVDFLLVRSGDLAPLAGIELDDSSHEAEERRQRDAFVDSAFASAGLPLLHLPVSKAYNSADLKARVAQLLA